jgi:hypothetical protein
VIRPTTETPQEEVEAAEVDGRGAVEVDGRGAVEVDGRGAAEVDGRGSASAGVIAEKRGRGVSVVSGTSREDRHAPPTGKKPQQKQQKPQKTQKKRSVNQMYASACEQGRFCQLSEFQINQ